MTAAECQASPNVNRATCVFTSSGGASLPPKSLLCVPLPIEVPSSLSSRGAEFSPLGERGDAMTGSISSGEGCSGCCCWRRLRRSMSNSSTFSSLCGKRSELARVMRLKVISNRILNSNKNPATDIDEFYETGKESRKQPVRKHWWAGHAGRHEMINHLSLVLQSCFLAFAAAHYKVLSPLDQIFA